MNRKQNTVSLNISKNAGIIIAAALGIILIAVSALSGNIKEDNTVNGQNELDRYISGMEKRLCDTVSNIEGAGETQVFITVENTFETVYASNASIDESGDERGSSKTTQKQLAYASSGGSGEQPVVIKQICPKVSGVLVVCEGGGNTAVRQEIISSVSIAVGISANKIYVTGGNH